MLNISYNDQTHNNHLHILATLSTLGDYNLRQLRGANYYYVEERTIDQWHAPADF